MSGYFVTILLVFLRALLVLILVCEEVLFLEGSVATVDSIITAAGSAITTMQGNALSMIQTVVPLAIVVMSAVLVVRIGIRVFRQITGR